MATWSKPYAGRLRELERTGLRRHPLALDSGQARLVAVGGRQVLNFCSNDYLGLAGHPRVVAAAERGLRRWGWGSGASRLVTGTTSAHRALEEAVADFKGREAALVFGSGYAANLAAIGALAGPGDTLYCDRLDHASLVDAARLSGARLRVYPHGDLRALQGLLERPAKGRRLVLTESLYSMDGDLADLPALRALCDRHDAILYVDEAHALGVLGRDGRGAEDLDHWSGLEARGHVVMGTFSKALGGVGAFIASDRAVVDLVLQRGKAFVYSTAPPAAAAEAALEALAVLRDEPERRRDLLARAGQLGRALGLAPAGAIVPVLTGASDAAVDGARRLLEEGFLVVGIRPPTVPRGTARLRITLRADHTPADVDRLAAAIGGLGLAP